MKVVKKAPDDELDALVNARMGNRVKDEAPPPTKLVRPPSGAVAGSAGDQGARGGAPATTAPRTSQPPPLWHDNNTSPPPPAPSSGKAGGAPPWSSWVVPPSLGGGKTFSAGSSDDDVDQLAQTRADHERERKAAADDLAAEKARALQQANARAALGGMGLSGATAALSSDIGRSQDRAAIAAMADLGRKQRDEDFQAIQRQAAIADLEDAQDTDVDGDGKINGRAVGGKIGDGDPDNDPADVGNRKDNENKRNEEILAMAQPDFENLTQEELTALGWTVKPGPNGPNGYATYAVWTAPNGETRKAYIDDFGETYSNGLEWKQ